MTTKISYGLRIVICFAAFLFSLIIGSFVVSNKIIDLVYIIACIVFLINYFRLEW